MGIIQNDDTQCHDIVSRKQNSPVHVPDTFITEINSYILELLSTTFREWLFEVIEIEWIKYQKVYTGEWISVWVIIQIKIFPHIRVKLFSIDL
jgi:hypothetical protein